jgi:hypothetical protein
MSRRLSLAFLSVVFVYGLSITVAPGPASAARVNCDVNVCIDRCFRRSHGGGGGQYHISMGSACAPNCMQTMIARKKRGLCPK